MVDGSSLRLPLSDKVLHRPLASMSPWLRNLRKNVLALVPVVCKRLVSVAGLGSYGLDLQQSELGVGTVYSMIGVFSSATLTIKQASSRASMRTHRGLASSTGYTKTSDQSCWGSAGNSIDNTCHVCF